MMTSMNFEGASFMIGKEISFDLRKYAGHPDFTVSVYLPMQMENLEEISKIIDQVIMEFGLPKTAVGWRRGWDFNSGTVTRHPEDRLREKEAKILFLKIAALQSRCKVATTFVKNEVKRFYPLSPADPILFPNEPSVGRRPSSLFYGACGIKCDSLAKHPNSSRRGHREDRAIAICPFQKG